jgi:RNA polymerase sigma-70 factor (ECF subfamily)
LNESKDKQSRVVSVGEESSVAASQLSIETTAEVTRDERWMGLIERVAEGDQSALSALYDSTSRLAYGLVLRVLNDKATAEEVLLDVYMQVWRQAAQYDKRRGTPLAWLLTIARSRAIDRLRSGRHQEQLQEPLETAERRLHAVTPQDTTVASERQRLVRTALDSLSPEQREVIELAYYMGMSHSEIAARLSQPLGTVKTRTRLGMMKLREKLRPVYEGGL